MNNKVAKKLRRWMRHRYTAQFREYTKMMQEQPLKERLYFAWFIVFRRGHDVPAD